MTAPVHDVVLLPGLACDAGLYEGQLPALGARHRVVVSDVQTRCATIHEMAAALLAEHGGHPVLVGSSMGGMVAMAAALLAPARVKALALLGTSARADTPELLKLRSDAILRFEAGAAEEVLRANAMFAFHPDAAADAALVSRYVDLVLRAGAGQLIAQNRAVMARADLRAAIGTIGCPTLVVCGEADMLTPPAHSREIAAGIRGARLEIVPRCGHLMTLEQPDRISALLLDWLATLPTG